LRQALGRRGRVAGEILLKTSVLEAINAGVIGGKLALLALQALGREAMHPNCFHGTHVGPGELIGGVLKPHQAYWYDAHGNKFVDGQPAICAYLEPSLAIMRGFLHDNQPALAGHDCLVLTRGCDDAGRPYWFTTEEVLRRLEEAGARAWVHVLYSADGSPHIHPSSGVQEGEFRFVAKQEPDFSIKLGMQDLPEGIMVINAHGRRVRQILRNVARSDPFRVGRTGAIRVTGGAWPVHLFPSS
jgi:hypothetical protein